MSVSDQFRNLVTKAFDKAAATGSDKQTLLATMKSCLLAQNNDKAGFSHFSKVLQPDNHFSIAIDKQRGIKLWGQPTPTNTRTNMDNLQKDLRLLEERQDNNVRLGLMNDQSGHGFQKALPKAGNDNIISKAYVIEATLKDDPTSLEKINANLKTQKDAEFITKGDLFNSYNQSGLDYKGQSNYTALTLLNGGGLDIKVNLVTFIFPPAAFLGFSASVKASPSGLKGSQMIVYSEVINGNNGSWILPDSGAVKEILIANIAKALSNLEPLFFDIGLIKTGMQVLSADDIYNTQAICVILSTVVFTSSPKKLNEPIIPNQNPNQFHTEDRNGGPFAEDICIAVGNAQKETEIAISQITSGDSYSAIVATGCMRCSKVFEWTAKGGLELGWSPLNIAGIQNLTQFLSTSASPEDSMQYAALGLSLGLYAETTTGRTVRSFFAMDPNARLFAKGGTNDNSYKKMSSYISDCIRFSTDESLVEYIDNFFRSNSSVSGSDYKKLTLDQLLKETEEQLFLLGRQEVSLSLEEFLLGPEEEDLSHIKQLLSDRISQNKSDAPISFFYITYSATTWEWAANSQGKLGLKLLTSLANTNYADQDTGTKGYEFIATLLSRISSSRISAYTIQVPVIRTESSQELPNDVSSLLAIGGGVVEIKSLCDDEPGSLLFKTQTTIVKYHQIEYKNFLGEFADTLVKLETNAFPAILQPDGNHRVGQVLSPETLNFNPKDAKKKPHHDSFLNTIAYETITAVWKNPVFKSELVPLSLTEGSGRSYGQAFVLDKLVELVYKHENNGMLEADKKKLDMLAKSLHISWENLIAFFKSKEFQAVMPKTCQLHYNPWAKENFAAQEGCILIESTFSLINTNVSIIQKSKGGFITPAPLFESTCFKDKDKDKFELQAIRLRYRLGDLKETKTTPFKLGLFIPDGSQVAIRHEKVENIVMGGIVDICTYWYGQSASGTAMYNRNETVQSTVLITQ
jgi:hypothetical protein